MYGENFGKQVSISTCYVWNKWMQIERDLGDKVNMQIAAWADLFVGFPVVG